MRNQKKEKRKKDILRLLTELPFINKTEADVATFSKKKNSTSITHYHKLHITESARFARHPKPKP